MLGHMCSYTGGTTYNPPPSASLRYSSRRDPEVRVLLHAPALCRRRSAALWTIVVYMVNRLERGFTASTLSLEAGRFRPLCSLLPVEEDVPSGCSSACGLEKCLIKAIVTINVRADELFDLHVDGKAAAAAASFGRDGGVMAAARFPYAKGKEAVDTSKGVGCRVSGIGATAGAGGWEASETLFIRRGVIPERFDLTVSPGSGQMST